MADKPAAEQTEDPTPERIRRAREEGKLAQSHELPSAMLIVLLVVALTMLGPLLLEWLTAQMRQGLSFQYGSGTLDKLSLTGQLQNATSQTLLILLPVVLIGVFVSLMSALAVSGVAVSPKAVKIDWGRIAFGSGLQGLFSMRAAVSLITSMVKFVVIGAIVYFYLGGRMDEVLSLG